MKNTRKKARRKLKTLNDLALEYGIAENTMRKWIRPIEHKLNRRRRPMLEWQWKMIYELLERP